MIRILVWFLMIFGGAVLGFYIDHLLFEHIQGNLFFHGISGLFGILLLVLVMRISKNTGRTLAKFGRHGNLKRMETNVLVTEGVYNYMRHPMHFGLMLFPMSIAFILGSPSFILLIAPAEIIFMLIMIKFIEEPEAIRKFGNQYLEFKAQRPWFCFKLKCLRELVKQVPKN